MFCFDLNLTQGYEIAQLRQAMIRNEIKQLRKEDALARLAQAGEAENRQFRRMYAIRHWMHRLAPRLARAWML